MSLQEIIEFLSGKVVWILAEVPDDELIYKLTTYEAQKANPPEVIHWLMPDLQDEG